MPMNDTNEIASPGTCPALFFDGPCDNQDWKEPNFHFYPAYISTVSCSASCIGSGLIVLTYLLWKDMRTGLRKIVTYLAIADFFTAAGYLLGNVNYFHYNDRVVEDEVSACYLFDTVCQIQAFVTSWSSLSSFVWTAILAVYLYWALVKGDSTSPHAYFMVYHVLSWGSPLLGVSSPGDVAAAVYGESGLLSFRCWWMVFHCCGLLDHRYLGRCLRSQRENSGADPGGRESNGNFHLRASDCAVQQDSVVHSKEGMSSQVLSLVRYWLNCVHHTICSVLAKCVPNLLGICFLYNYYHF